MKKLTSLFSALALLFTTSLALAQGTGPAQYRVDNINALLQITLFGADAKVTAWVGGGSARDDGLGGMFFYDGTSAADTNVYAVFKPVNNTGRWWKLPTSVAYQTAAVTVATDTTYAWKLLRGAGATNFFGIGADNNIAYVQTFNGKNLHINNQGNNTILNSTAGNVGIGPIAPTSKLHVSKTGNLVADIQVQNSGAGTEASARVLTQADIATGFLDTYSSTYTVNGAYAPNTTHLAGIGTAGLNIGAENATGVIRLFTGGFAAGNERLRIDSAGLVGIGATITPTSLLSVGGAAAAGTLTATNGITVGGVAAAQQIAAIYSGAAQLDFGSIAANTAIDLTITITGSGTNSAVTVSRADGAMTGNVNLSAWVSATNTVTVRASNPTVGAIDPAAGSYRATVFQY